MKLVEKSPVAQEDQESDEVEHDSLQNFQPVIPLPAKVDVKTGEENEQVLFSSRAKLYRFVDKQWKERGIGILKILKDISGKCRILMRRDQVHKICANHFITGDMNLQRLPASEKAWVWFANDFADEKVQLEKLCAKFETVEEGKLFKASFDDVKLSSKDLFLSNSSENLDSAQVDSKSKDQASAISSSQQSKPSSSLPNYDFNITPKLNSKLFTNEDKKVQQPEQPAEPQVSQTSSTSGTVSVGGFTFLKPPKLILEDKTQVKVVEEKKSESPFATFSFTSGSSIEASTNPIQMSSKSSLKKPQNKVPEKQKHVMFLPGADLGAISKLEGNAVATTTPSKTVEGVVTPVFGSKFQMSSNVFNTNYAGSPRPNDELTLTGEFKPVVPLQLVDAKNVEKNKVDTNEKKKERVNCNCGEESCTVCKSQTTSCKADVSMSKQENKPDLSSIFKPKEGSWECEGCFVRNDANVLKCPACSTLKPGSSDNIFSVNKDINVISFGNSVNIKNNDKESEKKPTSSNWFKTDPPGSWECDTCLVRNTPEKTKCASCDSNKVKSAIPAKEGGPLWNSKFNFETSGFTFGAGSKEAPKFTIGSNNKYTFGAQPAEVTAVKQDVNSNAPSGTEFQFGISNSTQPGTKDAY
ncbi:hypothetical protein AAG570_000500 [Ranatra chinensis]|uniref:E3 SUMO-protein ligase RanBP2 n=1 Tax=Ranatra chinensis TaxID=642074 RepID=A0ABD0YX87_9HEMI